MYYLGVFCIKWIFGNIYWAEHIISIIYIKICIACISYKNNIFFMSFKKLKYYKLINMSNKVSTINIFNQCVKELEKDLNSTEINSWIKPLQFDLKENNFLGDVVHMTFEIKNKIHRTIWCIK